MVPHHAAELHVTCCTAVSGEAIRTPLAFEAMPKTFNPSVMRRAIHRDQTDFCQRGRIDRDCAFSSVPQYRSVQALQCARHKLHAVCDTTAGPLGEGKAILRFFPSVDTNKAWKWNMAPWTWSLRSPRIPMPKPVAVEPSKAVFDLWWTTLVPLTSSHERQSRKPRSWCHKKEICGAQDFTRVPQIWCVLCNLQCKMA